MKLIVADKREITDGSAAQMLERVNSPIPIMLIAWSERFKFNYDLVKEIKDYVLVCFCEYGWNWRIEDSHIWGVNTRKEGYGDARYSGEEWDKFDTWVKENPPKLIFKRELLAKDVTEKILPIEYPCRYSIPPKNTKAEFSRRPIQAMMYWGRSNERRLGIHSAIWRNAMEKGYNVIDNVYYFEKFLMNEDGINWATFNIPHYQRIQIESLLLMNSYSKIGISPVGAGNKCFRETEVSTNSVLCLHDTGMAYSYDWVHGENCIKMPLGASPTCDEEINVIEEALKRTDLYDIYVNGVENVKKYQFHDYITNYLEPLIKKFA
jgi:hypothetical protein